MKFRKRAVVVEASQWWKPGDHAVVIHPVPAEVQVPVIEREQGSSSLARAKFGAIRTLEGWMIVTPGDYIIRGVHGEHYACKPDIFDKTYERAESEPAPSIQPSYAI